MGEWRGMKEGLEKRGGEEVLRERMGRGEGQGGMVRDTRRESGELGGGRMEF
jgi:hypothetical protein